jgi:hypothetical protein
VDHVCILDLETFCDYFVQPRELAESLTEKAEQLVAAWMQKNGGPGMTGNRRPIGITYTLAHYEWLNAKNRKEESKHTLQLSTWGYTGTVQQSKNPIMGLNDVKVGARRTPIPPDPGDYKCGRCHRNEPFCC